MNASLLLAFLQLEMNSTTLRPCSDDSFSAFWQFTYSDFLMIRNVPNTCSGIWFLKNLPQYMSRSDYLKHRLYWIVIPPSRDYFPTSRSSTFPTEFVVQKFPLPLADSTFKQSFDYVLHKIFFFLINTLKTLEGSDF